VDNQRGAADRVTAPPRGETLPAPRAEMSREYDAPSARGDLAMSIEQDLDDDADRAALIADSNADQTAAVVRVRPSKLGPRLLSFESPRLAVEMEIDRTGRYLRMLGQLVPAGYARVEVRQKPDPNRRLVEADHLGRFVIENMCAGPTRLTCRYPGERPVATDWAHL
jgi:hypothetical protein